MIDDAASETLHIKDSFNVYIYSGYFQISDTESQNVYILLIPHNKIKRIYTVNIIRLLFRFCFRPIYCQQYLIAGLKEGAFLFIEFASPIKVFHSFLTGFPRQFPVLQSPRCFSASNAHLPPQDRPDADSHFAQSAKRFQQWMVYRSFCHSPARFLCRVWSWNSA